MTSRGRFRPRFRPVDAGVLDALDSLSLSSYSPRASRSGFNSGRGSGRWAGGGGGRSAGAAAAERHNVARLPELDYFVRKLDQSDDGGAGPKWDLPFAKAGKAMGLPDDFSSLSAYLDAMQAGAALEFQASIKQALEQAERERRYKGSDGFFTFVPRKEGKGHGSILGSSLSSTAGTWVLAPGVFGLDFEQDSWGKHLVEVEETKSFHVAVVAKKDEETEQQEGAERQVLVVLPTIEHAYRSTVRIRSLGYIGPFLAQYNSAQDLRYEQLLGTTPAATRSLLSAVVEPSRWRTLAHQGRSTLLPASASRLRKDMVAINASQERAVLGLRGGLDVIHGPPGTGKSTTIFHIIDSRVQEDAQVLVTCTRNQAVDAVVDKLAILESGILVFGNPKRLGERAAHYTIDQRVENHPAEEAWRLSLEALRQVQKQLLPGGSLAHTSSYTRESQVKEVLHGVLARASGATVTVAGVENSVVEALDQVVQGGYDDDELEQLVRGLVTDTASVALQALRAHVKKQLLEETRVFVCTIDSTARMAADLQELEVTLRLDTVVVDEAGCVLESAIPLLLRLHPSNLVLIGDHKQLQAFSSLVDPPANHCRHLSPISSTFYSGELRSGPSMLASRPCHPACRLVDVSGREEQHTGAGFSNREEALRVVAEAEAATRTLVAKAAVRPRTGGFNGTASNGSGSGNSKANRPSLFIVTLYNKQRGLILDLLESEGAGARLKAAGWEVAVLSADACQGSEADAVVLSTVRNSVAGKSSGAPLSRFFNDCRRLNVALSRARHLCVVAGSVATMRQAAVKEPAWRSLLQHYRVQS